MRFLDDMALDADSEVVWRRASDLQAMPTYWPAIRSVEVLRSAEDGFKARIGFTFGGVSKADILVDDVARTLIIYYTTGPLTGTQRVTVKRDRLVVELDVAFHGSSRLILPWENGRLKTEMQSSLARLVAPRAAVLPERGTSRN